MSHTVAEATVLRYGSSSVFMSFLAVMIAGLGSCRTTTIQGVLEKYGYAEVRPPSTLVSPGTIVTVKTRDPLVLGIVCPNTKTMGADAAMHIMTSDSAQAREAKELTTTFEVDSSYLGVGTASLSASKISKATISLTNVKVLELPDTSVFATLKDRSAECNSAVKFRRDNKQPLTMIMSVIQADVTYSLTFVSDTSAEVKAQITKEVAARLGLNIDSSGETVLKGSGLYWGVRDDERMATVSPHVPGTTGAGEPSRLLSPGEHFGVEVDN